MAHDSWTDGGSDIPVLKHTGEMGTCQSPICRAYFAGLRRGWDLKAEQVEREKSWASPSDSS